LIDGIYNYCDSRCARCKFSERCISYLMRQRLELLGPAANADAIYDEIAGPPPEQPVEVRELVAEIELDALSMTPEQYAVVDREHQQHVQSIADDRLVIAARGYAMSTWNITQALAAIVQARGDPIVVEAVESVAELAGPIASKVSRAISAALCDDEFDSEDVEHDANGCAKVARLAIEESRQAWRVLTESHRGAANGVPVAMLRVLDEIDAQLASRLPRAMAFVRPGFDTEDPP
jgi:hypothetical protein